MRQFGKLITKQKQIIKLIPILLLMCLLFGGCGNKSAVASPETEETTVEKKATQAATEEEKRTGQKYERVIALSPATVEYE